MFCNPLRQKHPISAPKNTQRSQNVIPSTALPVCDEYMFLCLCESEWLHAIYVCMSLVLIFVKETAIILTQDLITLQEIYTQLSFCEIYGETAHYGKKQHNHTNINQTIAQRS